jgi:hypothetical protein
MVEIMSSTEQVSLEIVVSRRTSPFITGELMEEPYKKLVDYLKSKYGEFKYVGIEGKEKIKKRVKGYRENHSQEK